MSGTVWKYFEKCIRAVLGFLFQQINKELSDETFEAFMQFVKFGIVGVSNTVIAYVVYAVTLIVFQKFGWMPKIDYLFAQGISFVVSVAWSYFWNNKMVFKLKEGEERSFWKSLLKTYISYSFTGLFLSSMLLYFWVNVLHISEFVAPIMNLLISVPINFLINKLWAFRTD